MINLPEFSLIEKNNLGGQCDGCGREIKNVYKLKNNVTGETGEYGSGCAENFMHGKTITDVVNEEKAYKKSVAEDEFRAQRGVRVQEFKELNPAMLAYIDANLDFSFLADMKIAIEKYGVLTQNQYDVVYGIMLKPAQLDDKIKDLELDIFRVKVAHNDFGTNYTLLGETADHKLVRVFFSSISEKNEKLLIDKKILKIDRDGYTFRPSTDFKRKITVSGSYDGYKLKRVKVA